MPNVPRGLHSAVTATAAAHPRIAVRRGYTVVAPELADDETAAWLDDAFRRGAIKQLDAPGERDGTPGPGGRLLVIPREWSARMTDDEIRTWLREAGQPDGRYPNHVVIRQEDLPDAHEEDIRAFLLEHHAEWEPLDARKAEALKKDTRPGEDLPTTDGEPMGFWVLPSAIDR
jgi:hypothetical protein